MNCKNDGKEIDLRKPLIRLKVTSEHYMGDHSETVQTDAGIFCSWGCLIDYATPQAEEEAR